MRWGGGRTGSGLPIDVADIDEALVFFAIEEAFAKPPQDQRSLPQRQLKILVYAVWHGVRVEKLGPCRL